MGKGLVSVLQRRISGARWAIGQVKVLHPAGQSLLWPMPREISVVWSSTPVCGVRLTQQWSETCLSYALKVVDSTLLGPFNKFLGTPAGKCGISSGDYLWVVPLCRHSYSDHMCRYLTSVSVPDVFTLN